MRAKQPTKLCKPRRIMRVKVGAQENRIKPPSPVIITDSPKAVLSLWFHLFYVRCCSMFKGFSLTLLLVQVMSRVGCKWYRCGALDRSRWG